MPQRVRKITPPCGIVPGRESGTGRKLEWMAHPQRSVFHAGWIDFGSSGIVATVDTYGAPA